MSPPLDDENITASAKVAGTTFALFGVSGWYWWTGVTWDARTWDARPWALHIGPMLDHIVRQADEIQRLRAVIDEYARGWDQASVDQGRRLREARKNLLTATVEADRG